MTGEGFVKTLPPGGRLEYSPHWLERPGADDLLGTLLREIDWESRTIRMFGRTFAQPRLLCFMGDAGIRYRYSGDEYLACTWHPEVRALRARLARSTGERYNSVLLNFYRDGADSMGWHADDEPELGPDPTIASVSLGAERRFVLRRRTDHGCKFEIAPAHGSLLLMAGALQHHWQHALPKTRRPVGARINLTFRRPTQL